MAVPANVLDMAREHVARSAHVIELQNALIRTLERYGMDARSARALLVTMYRSHLLMVRHLRQLQTSQWAPVARHNGLLWPLGPKDLVVQPEADRDAA